MKDTMHLTGGYIVTYESDDMGWIDWEIEHPLEPQFLIGAGKSRNVGDMSSAVAALVASHALA